MSRVQIALLLALLLGVLGLAALGKEDRKSFWERTTDDPVAAFTAALVLFTAVLAGVSMIQVRFLIRADETARIAATAAKRSADAVRSIERPWMVATADEVSLCDGIEAAVEGDPFTFKVPIKFVNEGRTSAFLEGFYAVSTIAAYPGPAIRNVRLKQTEGWDIKINMEGKSVGPGGQEARKRLILVLGLLFTAKPRSQYWREMQSFGCMGIWNTPTSLWKNDRLISVFLTTWELVA